MLQIADLSLPSSTSQDVADALTSSDPVRAVQAKLDQITRFEARVEPVKATWLQARMLAEMLAGAEVGSDEGEPGPSGDEAMPAKQNGTAETRPTRREAVVRLGRETVGRDWRLAEFVAELERRGWSGSSKHEDARVIRVLADLVAEGKVHKPIKGHYVFLPLAQEAE